MKKVILLSFLALLTLSVVTVKAQQVADKTTSTEVYAEINAYRAEHGLPALQVSETLEMSASVFAFNLNLTGKERHAKLWFAAHNRLCAEVIGGIYDPVDRWKKSSVHNRILLSKGFSHMGTGTSGGHRVVRFVMKS